MGLLLARPSDVLVRPAKADRSLRTGDVILFRNGSDLVIHRIIGNRIGSREAYMTKGDAVVFLDPPVTQDAVLGRVIGVRRDGRSSMPWYWRWPLCLGVAMLSRMELYGWPRVVHFLQYAYLRFSCTFGSQAK
jgi:hypothetical protein